MFPALRNRLAREGGNLLVSVLRDMLAGKVRDLPPVLCYCLTRHYVGPGYLHFSGR